MAPENNIYYNARKTAGMTQARWAEMLGVAEETVRRYEAGAMLPADDIVLAMADLSGLQILGTWHLRRKSAVAADVLPEVQRLPLAQAVVQLLDAIDGFTEKHHARTLISIAADGKVLPEEQGEFDRVVKDLQPLIRAALQIDFADKG